MTIDEFKRDVEARFVTSILQHPAGFHLGVFGVLQIRSCSESGASHDERVTYEVDWEELIDEVPVHSYKNFSTANEAALFFVEKRAELQLGVDYERELMKEVPP